MLYSRRLGVHCITHQRQVFTWLNSRKLSGFSILLIETHDIETGVDRYINKFLRRFQYAARYESTGVDSDVLTPPISVVEN